MRESRAAGLREKALRGGVFKTLAQGTTFTLRIGSTAVLARLLEPRDFGLVAMVTAVTGMLSLFKDAGLSLPAIQRSNINHAQLSTLFWLNVLIGAVLALACVTVAPALSQFYHDPRLLWVAIWTAPGFLLTGLGVQHDAILVREMRFSVCAAIDVAAVFVGAIVGITMAYFGFSYWALVGMSLATQATITAGVWITAGWIPGAPRRDAKIWSMIQLGGALTLNGVIIYLAYNVDKVLLGRFWGADVLGSYGRAYQLVSIPTDNLNSAVGSVALSTLSRLQDDPGRLKTYFLKGYSIVVALTIPATVVCAVFAEEIVAILLGPKWGQSAEIVRLLAPTILVFALINPMFWLVFSAGLMSRSIKIAVVIAFLVITAYTLGLPYGAQGVATAYSLVMTIWLVPHVLWCVHGTPVHARDVMRTASRPLIAGFVATVVCAAFKLSGLLAIVPVMRLFVGGCLLGVSYLFVLLYVMRQRAFYVDVVRGILGR